MRRITVILIYLCELRVEHHEKSEEKQQKVF
jgi:hypothetical protein